jgi:hypothetical protein
MATVKNFWDSFVPAEIKEARFGLIPEGKSNVHIIDVRPLRASQGFKLDDNGKITAISLKEDFDLKFDQDIVAVVFQDTEGRILIDRRSSIGWLTSDEKDSDGKIKVTAEFAQKYGLKSSGKRFLSSKGEGVPSKEKTASCLDMGSRLARASNHFKEGVPVTPATLLDSDMIIDVLNKPYDGKMRPEVIGYYPLGYVFKDKPADGIAAPKGNAPAPPPPVEEPQEDLPF